MGDDKAVALEALGLTRSYPMGEVTIQALRGVDLALYRGELLVMLGASGSGKSTLLNILGGLDSASGGEVRYVDHRGQSRDLTRASQRELTRFRRHHVGFVFQFYNLIPSLTARENVALVTEIARNPMRPDDALALVGLQDRVDHFPAQLSGGEQQRVALARAFVAEPAIILADEPTGNLDQATGSAVIDLLFGLRERHGTTLVLITHDPDLAHRCGRIVSLADGLVVSDRPALPEAA